MLLRVVRRSNLLCSRCGLWPACSGFALSRSCSGFVLLLVVAAARRVVVKLLAPVKPLAQAVRLAVGVQRVHVEQIAAQVAQIAGPVLIALPLIAAGRRCWCPGG